MPHYDYKCIECDWSIQDVQLPIAGRDIPCDDPCPRCSKATVERVISAPGVSYTVTSVRSKTPEGFKDILRKIKSEHRGSTIDV